MENKRLFAYIWKTYGKKIYWYIGHILPAEKDSCEDLYQEVMAKVYTALNSYDHSCHLQPWLYRIARNHCIDYLKGKKETHELSDKTAVGPENRIEEESEQEEEIKHIHRAIEKLEPGEKEIVYLHYFEKMKYKEIGAVLGLNVNTVKTRMKRSRQKLKHYLGGMS